MCVSMLAIFRRKLKFGVFCSSFNASLCVVFSLLPPTCLLPSMPVSTVINWTLLVCLQQISDHMVFSLPV